MNTLHQAHPALGKVATPATIHALLDKWPLLNGGMSIDETLDFYDDVQSIERETKQARGEILRAWVTAVSSDLRIQPEHVMERARLSRNGRDEFAFSLSDAAIIELRTAQQELFAVQRKVEEKIMGVADMERRLRLARERLRLVDGRITQCAEIRDELTSRRQKLDEAEVTEVFGDIGPLSIEPITRRAFILVGNCSERFGVDAALELVPKHEERLRRRREELQAEVNRLVEAVGRGESEPQSGGADLSTEAAPEECRSEPDAHIESNDE